MKKVLLYLSVSLLVFVCAVALGLWWMIPSEKEIRSCMTTTMFQVELCPGSKNYVPLRGISNYLIRSVILTEDSRFYEHEGFDWESIEKSAKENLAKGEYKRGGSTITQQLAKNLFLSPEKSLFRKFREMLITYKLEKVLSKKEILERYLNVVELGKGIYGVRAAALHYFQKSPSQLSVVESAYLALLLPSPVKYSRSFYKKQITPFVQKRLHRIVNDLHQYSRITDAEYEVALNELRGFLNPAAAFDETLPAEDDIDLDDEFSTLDSEI